MPRVGQVSKVLLQNERKDIGISRRLVALGYARFSDSRKVGGFFTSAEAQEAIIREYAKNNPQIHLEKVYADPGKSGKDTNRPGYQKMCQRIAQGVIDIVIAYKLDRMGRNDDDLHSLFRLLSDYNISLIYTNGPNFDQTPDGEYMKRISVANAVFERELASRRVADKYIEALKRGIMSGARRPLGYISGDTPGSAIIDKNASLIVQRIFALCLEGKPPSEIAILANREFGGIPVRKFKNGKCDSGGKFTENKIRSIILNPFYAGYVYATISGYGTIDVKYKLYDGIHKAIISKNEWQNAVNLLKSNRREKNAYPSIRKADAFILKKYLRCECGAHMTVASSGKKTRNGEIYRYYACTRKKHLRGGCDCKTHIPLNIIEPIVFASIGYFLKDDAKSVAVEDDESEYINQTRSKLEILKKEFKKLDANLNTQLELFANFDASQAVKENIEGKIRKLGNELEENNEKRNRFEEDLRLLSQGKNISASKIDSSLEDLYGLQANLSEEEKREILSLCVEKIVLKCLTKKGRFKRQMCIRIFSREEFREKIPSSEIIFKLNTHSGAPDWEIISPFRVATGFRKNGLYQPQKRHWIGGVMRNKTDFESSGLSMRKYCAKNKIPFSMFQRRLHLLKSLSGEVLEYLRALKLKEETSLCSFRSLYELSSLPKPLQLQRLKDKINYN